MRYTGIAQAIGTGTFQRRKRNVMAIKNMCLSPTPSNGSDHAATDGSVTESVSTQESAQLRDPKSARPHTYGNANYVAPESQDTFAPIVASVLSPMVNKSIQDALKPLQTLVNQQQFLIESQQSDLDARKMERLPTRAWRLRSTSCRERHMSSMLSIWNLGYSHLMMGLMI